MIRHVVVFRCTGEDLAMRSSHAQEVQRRLETLRGRVPELRHLEVGISDRPNDTHWDAVLVTEFESTADLDAYQAHPEHQHVIAALDPLVRDRAIVDYQCPVPRRTDL